MAKDLGPVLAEQAPDAEIAILFGREDSGLSNDELQPTILTCRSLPQRVRIFESGDGRPSDLLQGFQYMEQASVQVSADSQLVQDEVSAMGQRIWDKDPASGVQMDKLLEHLQEVMVATGFVDPANPGNTVTRLRRLFMRQQLDETEVQILRGMLKSVQRRIK